MWVVESLHFDEMIVGIAVEGMVNAVLFAVLGFGFDHDPGGDHALVERVDVVGDDCDDHPVVLDPIGSQADSQKGGVGYAIDMAIALIDHQLESQSIAVEEPAGVQVGHKQERDELVDAAHGESVERRFLLLRDYLGRYR